MQHNRWQEKPDKRSGSTIEGFDEPNIMLHDYPMDTEKRMHQRLQKA